MSKRYCVDIDGTICSPTVGREYHKAEPCANKAAAIAVSHTGTYVLTEEDVTKL